MKGCNCPCCVVYGPDSRLESCERCYKIIKPSTFKLCDECYDKVFEEMCAGILTEYQNAEKSSSDTTPTTTGEQG